VDDRNSGDPLRWENVVIEAIVALETDPNLISQAPTALKPQLVTVRQYLATIPLRRPEVIEGLVERGSLLAVVAKPKVAKSLLTLGLSVVVARGTGTWLGRTVSPGRVAIFQLEDSPRTIGRRLQAMLGNSMPDDLLLHLADAPFHISAENFNLVADAIGAGLCAGVEPR
jgi:hypothetical protein